MKARRLGEREIRGVFEGDLSGEHGPVIARQIDIRRVPQRQQFDRMTGLGEAVHHLAGDFSGLPSLVAWQTRMVMRRAVHVGRQRLRWRRR